MAWYWILLLVLLGIVDIFVILIGLAAMKKPTWKTSTFEACCGLAYVLQACIALVLVAGGLTWTAVHFISKAW